MKLHEMVRNVRWCEGGWFYVTWYDVYTAKWNSMVWYGSDIVWHGIVSIWYVMGIGSRIGIGMHVSIYIYISLYVCVCLWVCVCVFCFFFLCVCVCPCFFLGVCVCVIVCSCTMWHFDQSFRCVSNAADRAPIPRRLQKSVRQLDVRGGLT